MCDDEKKNQKKECVVVLEHLYEEYVLLHTFDEFILVDGTVLPKLACHDLFVSSRA